MHWQADSNGRRAGAGRQGGTSILLVIRSDRNGADARATLPVASRS
jgi:hypothetical protein